MATLDRKILVKDFELKFLKKQSSDKELRAAIRSKWGWVVFESHQNARWYSLIIANLLRSPASIHSIEITEIRSVVNSGIKREAFDRLRALMKVSKKELESVVRISARTLSRRVIFQPDETERILRVAATFHRTLEVFEDLDTARQWFVSDQRALGNKTALEFCDTEMGADEVMNLLGRIEHGVFS